ncbi:hypothetical protein Cgig2_029103 [Carnegiea gigantea]|uniref:DUF4283 domain-containing protein n=1 Tax=Carnegiea gigantea TaxID=171969 RepID=A0A9Q1GKH8_9CARY|nr:hypothetical protein Cgig2_029103 [Carnegiea gigantea]
MARGGRRGIPKANRGRSEDREHSPQASIAPISSEQSSPVASPSSKQQINGTLHEQVQNQTRVLPSFASMVDPDDDMALRFIPVSDFTGTKCAKLTQEDIMEVLNCWQNVVLYCVLGANPPYKVMAVYNVLIRQKVSYEWLPLKCSHCKIFGHIQENCRAKTHQEMEWRVRSKEIQEEQNQTLEKAGSRGDNDFQLATKHITRHYVSRAARPKETATPDDLLQVNFYNALLEEDHPRRYQFTLILKTDQLIHGEAIHLLTNKKFYISFICGKNLEEQRLPL